MGFPAAFLAVFMEFYGILGLNEGFREACEALLGNSEGFAALLRELELSGWAA